MCLFYPDGTVFFVGGLAAPNIVPFDGGGLRLKWARLVGWFLSASIYEHTYLSKRFSYLPADVSPHHKSIHVPGDVEGVASRP